MTMPLDSATPISRRPNREKFWQSESIYGRFGHFSLRMCRIGIINASDHYRSQLYRFPINGQKLWRFDNFLVKF